MYHVLMDKALKFYQWIFFYVFLYVLLALPVTWLELTAIKRA